MSVLKSPFISEARLMCFNTNSYASSTYPYFDNEFSADDMRAPRNEEDETYYVPANMKYEECM